jgi:hypothetical protein
MTNGTGRQEPRPTHGILRSGASVGYQPGGKPSDGPSAPDFDQLPSSRQTVGTRSDSCCQGVFGNDPANPGLPLTHKALHRIPHVEYQQKGIRHHDFGYHESGGDNSSGSIEKFPSGGSRKSRAGVSNAILYSS